MKSILLGAFLIFSFFSYSQENENHFFIDNMIGYGIYHEYFPTSPTEVTSYVSSNINMGHKFYFGDDDNMYQPGFALTWLKIGVNIPMSSSAVLSTTNFSLINVGYINMLNLNENMSLEIDLNVGINTFATYYLIVPSPKVGIEFSPKVQLHFNKMNVGYSFSLTNELSTNKIRSNFSYQLHSLVIGFKI